MSSLAWFVGVLSGLSIVDPGLDSATLLVTGFAVQLTYGIVCRIFAAQAGRNRNLWGLAGLLCGVLAFAALLLATERRTRASAPLGDDERNRKATGV